MATHSKHANYNNIMKKWLIRHPLAECATRPRLNHCPDSTKLACHRRARYKMERIYTQAKVRSPGNIKLAREKSRRQED